MAQKELFKLTPIKPEYKGNNIEGYLYTFGGYTSTVGDLRLSSQYLQDKISIRQNKEFQLTDPLGNFWENATIRIQLKGIKIPNDNLILLKIKLKTDEQQTAQIYFGIQKLKEEFIEGLKIIESKIKLN